MRIVTRPDFDGVVCAALLYEAEDIQGSVKWVEPNEIQKGLVDVREGDIIANLSMIINHYKRIYPAIIPYYRIFIYK